LRRSRQPASALRFRAFRAWTHVHTTCATCLAVALTGAVACAPERHYPEPPAATYSLKSFALAEENGTSAGIDGAEVSTAFFAEVQPILGRLFVEIEYRPDGTPVAVVSHRCWMERFGSQPELVGRVITLDGRRRTVVGVLPPGFDFPKGACVWVPRPKG
jgi:hypothetical protein